MYAATGGPNVKWGAPTSNAGAGHHWPPRCRRPYGYLTYNEKVLIHTTHIKKVIAKHNFFILRSKTTGQQQQVRNFAEVRNFA